MAQYPQTSKPTKLNLDKSSKYLAPDESFFLLNHEVNSVLGKATPMPANHAACDMIVPAGENYAPNTFYSPLTNETYSWVFNSNVVHYIQRINGYGICDVVYSGSCLQLSADPKAQITQFRAYLDVTDICTKVPGGKLKRLIWTDGREDSVIGAIDVEASIATNFFTTPFFDRCADECATLQLCVPEPQGCLVGEFVPRVPEDADKSNRLLDKGFKFMYRYVYYDQRASEWSDRSTLYFQDTKGCFDSSEGFPRCIKFRLPIGNPMVEKIEFAFSEDGGIKWYLSETIEKYKSYDSSQQYWYQRELAEGLTNYSDSDCSFDYIFCNDKQRTPIDPLQVSRVGNFILRGAQGLLRVKESLAPYNYIKGFCPVDKNEADKFSINISCAEAEDTCETEFVDVTVRAIIHSMGLDRNGFIYRMNGGAGAVDDKTDPAWFGSTYGAPLAAGYQGYNQTFSDETRGFIIYVEGTNYWAETEQWRSSANFVGTPAKVGVLAGIDDSLTVNIYHSDVSNGNFYYSEAKIKMPKGTKGFLRIASHHETSGAGNAQDTSTQVLSVIGPLTNYNGTTTFSNLEQNKKEIYFDTCDGDVVITSETFLVEDMFQKSGLFSGVVSSAYSGYLTDINNQPVEGARMYRSGSWQATTDHNGFYSFYKHDGTSDAITIGVHVEQDCVSSDFTEVASFSSQSSVGSISEVDYQIDSEAYGDGYYAAIEVPVTDCNDVAVAGIRVALSGNKYKVTGTDGIARFKVRNYNTRDRHVRAIIMDKGACFFLDCDGNCNPCLPSSSVTALAACFMEEGFTDTYILTPTTRVNTASITSNKAGLKKGGRYAFGFVVEGDCGVLSAANHLGYFDVPRLQEGRGVCVLTYNAGAINLPSDIKRLKLVRSANLNPYRLQWVVDEIERTSDGKIKLTIQSLNDYNANHNFKTNTIYQYLQGDRVEFIRNGDGKIFDTETYGVLNYLTLSPFHDEVISGETDPPADYFNQLLIQDDGKLDNLEKGAIIEIQTPAISTTELTYFEICASIPVSNGQVLVQSGTFETFDTFLVSRQIDRFPAQFFESRTPSDFWGGDIGLSDVGKPHFANKFENQRRFGRNISIGSPTQLNYFGDFEKTFDAKEHGDLIAVFLKDDKIGLAIAENDNFLFQIGDDLLRLGSDNVVRAAPADAIISNPEAKLRGEFGCSYPDIGSILSGDGFILWIDAKHDAYIIHNYSFAKKTGESVSQEGMVISQCNSFFKKRIREKENFNRTSTDFLNYYRYATGINKNTGAVYLTIKALRHAGINNGKAVYELPNETIAYHPDTDTFLTMCSFTPEAYSQLNLNTENGCSFLTFQNSLPYIHPTIADKWNEFYDISCDWLVGVSVNADKKIIVPIAIEVQSETMFYVAKVTTDLNGFLSEIPAVRFKKNGRKWNAAFLNDINSRGGLYNGQAARGYAVNVLFIRDNTIGNQYGSIDNNKKIQYSELDQILIKFMLSESAGMTENL